MSRGEPLPADSVMRRVRYRRLALACVTYTMIVTSASVISIALPSMQNSLKFGDAERTWVITGSAAAFGGLLLVGGKLTDFFGVRMAYLVGLTGIVVMSAVGGAAINVWMLVASRVGEGAFGALLAPATLSIITATFRGEDGRRFAFGVVGATISAASAVSLVVGGVLIEFFSWRSVFYVNAALALPAIFGALALLEQRGTGPRPRLRVAEAFVITIAIAGVVLGLSRTQSSGWTSLVVMAPLIGGAVLVVGFVWRQHHAIDPMIPTSVLFERTRGASLVALFLTFMAVVGTEMLLNYYLQASMGFTPITAGLALTPMAVAGIAGASMGTNIAVPRIGTRFALGAGVAIAGAGMVLFARMGLHSLYLTTTLPGVLLVGFGTGFVLSVAMNGAVHGIGAEHDGIASAVVNVVKQTGIAIGAASLSVVAAQGSARYTNIALTGTTAAAHARVAGYNMAFAAAAVILLIAAVLVTLLAAPKKLNRA